MLSFVWSFFGWENEASSLSVSSNESRDEVPNRNQQDRESMDEKKDEPFDNDNLSMSELTSRFPALSRGDQFVTIRKLAHDVSGYFAVSFEDALFEVAVVSKYLQEPFDDILVGKWALLTSFNREPSYERLNGFIEEHKTLIEKTTIYKHHKTNYEQFVAIRRNDIDNIKCDEYGFVTEINDELSKKYNLQLYDQIVMSDSRIVINKLPTITSSIFPILEMKEISDQPLGHTDCDDIECEGIATDFETAKKLLKENQPFGNLEYCSKGIYPFTFENWDLLKLYSDSTIRWIIIFESMNGGEPLIVQGTATAFELWRFLSAKHLLPVCYCPYVMLLVFLCKDTFCARTKFSVVF